MLLSFNHTIINHVNYRDDQMKRFDELKIVHNYKHILDDTLNLVVTFCTTISDKVVNLKH